MKAVLMFSLVVLLSACALAGGWPQQSGTWGFSPSVSFYSAQRQYSPTGGMTHIYYDGTFNMTVLTLYGEWGATEDLTIIGDIPVFHAAFEARDSLHTYTRTLTAPSYVGAGMRYAVYRTAGTVVSLAAALHVPPGFHRGLFDDPSHGFLSDGYFEAVAGIECGATTRWGWVEAATLFHARDEEAVNELEMRGVVGFSSQKLVKVKISVIAMKALAPLPDLPLNVEETTTAEDYVWMDGQVLFTVAPNVTVAASLGVRVLGAHTLALSGGGISVLF